MSKRSKIITVVIIIVVVVAGVAAYAHTRDNDDNLSEAEKSNVEGQLDSENRQKENEKKQNRQNSQSNSDETDAKVPANPVLARWGARDGIAEAAGFIQGVFEEGGTCTYKFTQGTAVITRTSTSVQDATITNCPPVQISVSDFPTQGAWKVQLAYDSAAASGSSNEQTLNLP